MNPTQTTDAVRAVLSLVARADRRRRGRDTLHALVRVAPIAAAIVLATAGLGRWLGWRPILPLGLLAVLTIAFVIWAMVGRRARTVSDATAARVDAAAGLGGELRSAHWFASTADAASAPWPVFHLDRAAARLAGVSWDQVYPPVRAHRAWTVTAVCAVATLALSYNVPSSRAVAGTGKSAAAGTSANPTASLPPELAQRLQDLLSKAQTGMLSAEEAKKLADINNLLKKIDPSKDPKMADLAKRLQDALEQAGTKPMAEGGKADAANEDLKAAMDDLASKLAKGQAEPAKDNPNGGAPNADENEFGKSTTAGQKSAQVSVQMVRSASTEVSENQPMMPAGGAQGGDTAGGRGGNSPNKGAGQLLKLQAEALRRELVEANVDTAGQNVTKEDLRKKTEQGKSGLSFTHVTAAAIDRGRAVPPPPVPDARKALVQSYFIRKQ